MNMMIGKSKKSSQCTCGCGSTMLFKKGTLTRTVRSREIRIHKAPYYECVGCGEIEYDLSDNITTVFVKAYCDGVSEVDYDELMG